MIIVFSTLGFILLLCLVSTLIKKVVMKKWHDHVDRLRRIIKSWYKLNQFQARKKNTQVICWSGCHPVLQDKYCTCKSRTLRFMRHERHNWLQRITASCMLSAASLWGLHPAPSACSRWRQPLNSTVAGCRTLRPILAPKPNYNKQSAFCSYMLHVCTRIKPITTQSRLYQVYKPSVNQQPCRMWRVSLATTTNRIIKSWYKLNQFQPRKKYTGDLL